jgi:hypothetical protein
MNAFGKVFAAIALADRLASYGEPILINRPVKISDSFDRTHYF